MQNSGYPNTMTAIPPLRLDPDRDFDLDEGEDILDALEDPERILVATESATARQPEDPEPEPVKHYDPEYEAQIRTEWRREQQDSVVAGGFLDEPVRHRVSSRRPAPTRTARKTTARRTAGARRRASTTTRDDGDGAEPGEGSLEEFSHLFGFERRDKVISDGLDRWPYIAAFLTVIDDHFVTTAEKGLIATLRLERGQR